MIGDLIKTLPDGSYLVSAPRKFTKEECVHVNDMGYGMHYISHISGGHHEAYLVAVGKLGDDPMFSGEDIRMAKDKILDGISKKRESEGDWDLRMEAEDKDAG